MPYFRYRAIDPMQRVQSGQLFATDAACAEQYLAEQQWVLLSLHLDWRSQLTQIRGIPNPFGANQNTREQQRFLDWCSQLQGLLCAGINLEEALIDLQTTGPVNLRNMSADILREVRTGQNLSQALLRVAARPGVHLEQRWLRLLAAGEQSGHLLNTLAQLVEHLGWDLQQRQHTRSQLLQPLISGFCVLGATLFLILHLAPQIRPMLDQKTFSGSTQLLFWLTDTVHQFGLLLCLGCIIVGLLVMLAYHYRPTFRAALQTAGLRIPVLGQIPLLHDLVMYSRTLALLQRNNIPLLQAMADSRDTLANTVIRSSLMQAEFAVETGLQLHQAFAESPALICPDTPVVWPNPFLQLIQQGERTGQLAQALQHIADQLQHRRRTLIQRQQSLLQPVTTLLSGALLAWVAIALLGPFYEQLGRVW